MFGIKIITNRILEKFKNYLIEEEKAATIEKYVLDYKQKLIEVYVPASVNSIFYVIHVNRDNG